MEFLIIIAAFLVLLGVSSALAREVFWLRRKNMELEVEIYRLREKNCALKEILDKNLDEALRREYDKISRT